MKSLVYAIGLAVSPLAAATALAGSGVVLDVPAHHGSAPLTTEITSWSWGANQGGSSSASTGGRRAAAAPTDLATLHTQGEVSGFRVALHKSSPLIARVCGGGKHFPDAVLKAGDEAYEITGATVTQCSTPSAAPRQMQGATFGERCAAGACTASESVSVTLTGQLRHVRTGHVTIMK